MDVNEELDQSQRLFSNVIVMSSVSYTVAVSSVGKTAIDGV